MPNVSTKTYFVGNESKTYFVGNEPPPTTQSVRGIAPRTLLCNYVRYFILQCVLLLTNLLSVLQLQYQHNYYLSFCYKRNHHQCDDR